MSMMCNFWSKKDKKPEGLPPFAEKKRGDSPCIERAEPGQGGRAARGAFGRLLTFDMKG